MTQPSLLAARELSTQAKIEQLEAMLQKQLRGMVWEFSIGLLDVGLILRGQASSYHGKQLAQHAVMKVMDMPIHANEIQVKCM
jgi:hypothetical protein